MEIKLYKTSDVWVCQSEEYRDFFNTDILPTPYSSDVHGAYVYNQIKRLNPNDNIIVINN